jgi:hypothetical protein
VRLLSSSLLAAQKSASARPYLKVAILDRIGGARRLAFSRLYTGSEPDGYHAATMPGDGSLLRARVAGGRLYYQRVSNPGAGSDFSSWTDLGTVAGADVALCSEGSRALLFYVDTDGRTLKVRESTDNGATLGSPVTVATAAATVEWLAADVKSSGDAVLLYSVGATVYAVKRSGGSWGSPASWSNSVASVSGLACHHQGDWNAVVTGSDAAGIGYVWTCLFGDGFSQAVDTWSALREVTRASSGSQVSFRAPFLAQPDSYRMTFVEKYTGSVSYKRPYHSYSPATADYAQNLWREPVPFDLTSDFGLALAFSATAVWLSTPAGAWTATLDVPSLDVTDEVLEAATHDRPFEGRLRLTLRNDDGRYSTLPDAIKAAAEVRVSPGYVTSAGVKVSDGPAYWIDSIERTSGPGNATLVLKARDAWGLLEGWRARRQYEWSAGEKNVFGILEFVFARAGLEFSSVGASATASDFYPAFTISPGQSGLTAARRLLAMLPDVIFVRGEFAFLFEPKATDAADYAYGTDHPLFGGRYADVLTESNRAQVFGDGVFAERFEWPGVESAFDRLRQARDVNLTSVAEAEDRADAMLRHEALAATDGEIVTPVNAGQELYDVVEVTDARAGLTAAKRRVLGISLRYSTAARPAYEQRLALGGV